MEERQRDGVDTALGLIAWLANAAMFVIVGIAMAGFGYIIADAIFGTVIGIIAGLVTFFVAGYLAVKITNFVFGGIGRAIGGLIRDNKN